VRLYLDKSLQGWITVTFRVTGIAFFQEMSECPSGRLPSEGRRPAGSSVEGDTGWQQGSADKVV